VNGLTPPKSGAAEWPSGTAPRASRGAPPPSEPFAGILDSHQARTANAEGQDRSPRTKGQNPRRDNDGPTANERAEARSNARWARERREADGIEREHPVQHHGDVAPQPEADPATTPADLPATPVAVVEMPELVVTQPVLTDIPVVAPVTGEPTAPETAPVVTDAPVQQQQATPELAAAATAAAAPPQSGDQPEPVQAPVAEQAQAEVVTTTAEDAAQVATQSDDEATTAPQTDAKPADRGQAQPTAPGKPASHGDQGGQGQGQQQQREPGTLPQQAADQARTVAQAYGRVQHTSTEVPTAQSGTPAAPSATPVAPGQSAAARAEFAPATPVPLSRAAENVEHVLRLAANRGVTHARIALNPESLGSVDVHLRHTSDGLVAHVVAHAPEAVQQLQQAAADLRRQLEGQGVNLLSLDIGQSAGDERSAGRAGSGFGDDGSGRNGGQPAGTAADTADAEVTVNSTLQLPNGVLVDVLA
jgi:flagellar hook-length control protein FliK